MHVLIQDPARLFPFLPADRILKDAELYVVKSAKLQWAKASSSLAGWLTCMLVVQGGLNV